MDGWKKLGCWLVISKLEQMSRYLDTMHSAIQDNQRQVKADLEAMTENMTEEDKSDFYDFYADDLMESGSDFPILLFSGFVITWYSFIEHELISVCKTLDLTISVYIQDDTRYDDGIKRAYKFLDKGANYKIDNNHWQRLDKIRQVRNKLVHEGGKLIIKPTERTNSVPIDLGEDGTIYLLIDKDLDRYLNKHNLYGTGYYRLTPDYAYCKHLVEFGTELLTKIYKDFNLNI